MQMISNILHCDMNNCYATIEAADNPSLNTVPLVIGGSEFDRHGIVLAKNKLAKQFGIKTGETLYLAKQKCPNLKCMTPNFSKYEDYSKKARAIYAQYTNQVQPFGLDECWLDLTNCEQFGYTAHQIAKQILMEMKQTLGVTLSIGLSFSKMFAKLGSDLAEADSICEIPINGYQRMLAHLPIQSILGIGSQTMRKLWRYGLYDLGDLYQTSCTFFKQTLGLNGVHLWEKIHGLDHDPVAYLDAKEKLKSVGRGITCRTDLHHAFEVKGVMSVLAEKVASTLHLNDLSAKVVQISIKDTRLERFQCQHKLEIETKDPKILIQTGMQLFEAYYQWHYPVRALSIRAMQLIPTRPTQINLTMQNRKQTHVEQLDKVLFQIRQKYGFKSIGYGHEQTITQLPLQMSDTTVLPRQFT